MPKPPKLIPIILDGTKVDIAYYLSGDFEDISIVCEELPAVIEWINEQFQRMHESRLVQEQKLKQAEATVYFALKSGGFAERYHAAGRCTEEAVKHAIQLDVDVIAAHESFAVLDAWCRRLHNLQDSLQAKLQLIRTVEATRRKVFEPEN